MKRILIAGLPGSGKTTQAKKLAEELGLCVVSVGDALREFAKGDSDLAHLVKKEMNKGDLIEDDVAGRVVRQRVNAVDCEVGFIIDGYPRSLEQLHEFDPEFNEVIFLQISEELAEKRLLSRGRTDDDPNVVKHRLKVYKEHTEPIIEYFTQLGLVKVIDGEADVEIVAKRVLEALKLKD